MGKVLMKSKYKKLNRKDR